MAAISPTSLFLALCILHGLSTFAVAQPGYVSIDCGGRYNQRSNDSVGISWISDDGLIRSGETGKVFPPGNNDSDFVFSTLRYFPDNRTKNCYLLDSLTVGKFYLIRASFWAGESSIYDTLVSNRLSFKLLIDADEWADISIDFPQAGPLRQELYLRGDSPTVAVCVARTEPGTDVPFISSIEMRPLPETLSLVGQETPAGLPLRAVLKEYRINYGALSDTPIRYPDDHYDRIWDSKQTNTSLHTSSNVTIVEALAPDLPPLPVMQTAYVHDGGFNIILPLQLTTHFYLGEIYAAEIDPRVNAVGEREFSIQGTGISYEISIDLHGLFKINNVAAEMVAHAPFSVSGDFNLSFRPVPGQSKYPPLISAIELFRLFDNPLSNGTVYEDILAVNALKSALVDLSDWTGDPCLPNGYGYSWLNCSFATPPEVTVLSLSKHNLVGQIPPSISNLTGLREIFLDGNRLTGTIPDLSALENLQKLNLSNNDLSGTIPNSLSTLPSLRFLSLQNNNLSGGIPEALLQKMHNGALQIEYAGNALLCNPSNAKCSDSWAPASSLQIFVITGLIVASLAIIAVAVGTYAYCVKRRIRLRKQNSLVQHTELAEASKMVQIFNYRDIEVATHNFRKKLGEGGFGPVYEGQLSNGQLVAVKILSETSRQGVREFVNEVGLLSRVHHRNLVGLLGYCIEQKLVLVYEYMSRGTLSDALYGENRLDVPWKTRLRIAFDAAQGVEYLHLGCSPPIIHRDVKSSNILLNNKLEAKISDFGISRFRRDDSSPFSTTVMGTNGYHDPEYRSPENLSEKVDVYSFGIVLMEIICGRHPINRHVSQTESLYIVDSVRVSIERGSIEGVVDKALGDEYNMSSICKFTDIAMSCVSNSSNRPSMSEVCLGLREALRMEHGDVDAVAFNHGSPAMSGNTEESFPYLLNSPGETVESLSSLRLHGR